MKTLQSLLLFLTVLGLLGSEPSAAEIAGTSIIPHTVWNFNGRSSRWGVDRSFDLETEGLLKTRVNIYIATRSPSLRDDLEQRRQRALAVETAHPVERDALELIKK